MNLSSAIDSPQEILSRLHIRTTDLQIRLSADVPLQPMGTSALRGILGHALRDIAPEWADQAFKADDGHSPPAFLLRPLLSTPIVGDTFPVRLVTWDREGTFAETILEAFAYAAHHGAPFSGSGARLASLDLLSDPTRIAFEPVTTPADSLHIRFDTPLALRATSDTGKKTPVTPADLTPLRLLRAVAARLNALSRSYGNGLTLRLDTVADSLPGLLETKRHLRWHHSARHSSVQDTRIALDGILGELHWCHLASASVELLHAAELLHVGRHIVEGCGSLSLSDFPHPTRDAGYATTQHPHYA